jgi:hypothetical protein
MWLECAYGDGAEEGDDVVLVGVQEGVHVAHVRFAGLVGEGEAVGDHLQHLRHQHERAHRLRLRLLGC